jgi:hypothetical protein
MITIRKTIISKFDDAAERARINDAFEGAQREKMLKVLDLFCEGRLREAADYIKANFGYDEEEDCKEMEFLHETIYDIVYDVVYDVKDVEYVFGK